MAIMDKKIEFSDAQAICAFTAGDAAGIAAYSVASTNVINLGTGYNCWGDTEYNKLDNAVLNIRCAADFTNASGTVIYLKTHSSASTVATVSGTTVKSWTIGSTAGTATGPIKAGMTLVKEQMPLGYSVGAGIWTPLSQYIALWFANLNTPMAAGSIDAWIALDAESEVPRS
jgi:hypothetical protein